MGKTQKIELYRKANIYKIPLLASAEAGQDGHPTPGFFSSYQRVAQFHNQLRAPFVMPLVCLAAAAHKIIDTLLRFSLFIVNACLLDFEQAEEQGRKILPTLFGATYFLVSAIADTLYALVALITRTLTTVISFVARGGAPLTGNQVDSEDDGDNNSESIDREQALTLT